MGEGRGGRAEVDDAGGTGARHRPEGVPQDLGPEHHAGAAAEGAVIHVAKGVVREGPVAVGVQGVAQLPEGPARDAQAGGLEELRKQGEGVEAHHRTRAWKAFTEVLAMNPSEEAK